MALSLSRASKSSSLTSVFSICTVADTFLPGLRIEHGNSTIGGRRKRKRRLHQPSKRRCPRCSRGGQTGPRHLEQSPLPKSVLRLTRSTCPPPGPAPGGRPCRYQCGWSGQAGFWCLQLSEIMLPEKETRLLAGWYKVKHRGHALAWGLVAQAIHIDDSGSFFTVCDRIGLGQSGFESRVRVHCRVT